MQTILVNGAKLAFDRCGAGPALVLVHGFPLDHGIWQPLAERLAAHFDVIMPDLPGFGDSELAPGNTSMESMAAVLAGFLDALGIDAAYMAGHSMGGYVCLAFAHSFSERTLGLALLGSQALPDTVERKAGRYTTAEQIALSGAVVVAGMADKLSASPALAPLLREIILRQPPVGLMAALRAMAGRADAVAFIQRFTFPIILVHGLSDELIPPERAREIKALVPAARLVELAGVGHSAMLEAPAETAQALLHFLE